MDAIFVFLIIFVIIISISIIYVYIITNTIRSIAKQYTNILFNGCEGIESYSLEHIEPYIDKMKNHIPDYHIPDYSGLQFNESVYRHLIYVLLLYYRDQDNDLARNEINAKYYYDIGYDEKHSLVRIYILNNSICYIVIRGTGNSQDFMNDCKVLQVPIECDNTNDSVLKAHQGFYDIYKVIKPKLIQILKSCDISNMYIIGHSLGGAIATLMANDLMHYRPTIYTLATPYVVNKAFVDSIRDVNLWRIENEYDEICKMFISGVVHVDGKIDNYQKPGKLIYFESNINHLNNHQLYTYYDNIPNYKMLCDINILQST